MSRILSRSLERLSTPSLDFVRSTLVLWCFKASESPAVGALLDYSSSLTFSPRMESDWLLTPVAVWTSLRNVQLGGLHMWFCLNSRPWVS